MLAREGARVAVGDVNIEGARKVAASIPGAIAIAHDVTQEAQWQAALAEVERAFGGLHVLVNNERKYFCAPADAGLLGGRVKPGQGELG